MRHALVLSMLLSVILLRAQADDSTRIPDKFARGTRYVFTLANGEVLEGFVVTEDPAAVTVRVSGAGERRDILRSHILSARALSGRYAREPFGPNHHAGSYLLSHAAFPYGDAGVMTQSHWFVLENTDIVLADNWALTFNSLAFYPLSVGVKCAYEIGEDQHIGASAFSFISLGGNATTFFPGYGGVIRYTRGSRDHNLTASCGVLGISSMFFAPVSRFDYVNFGFVSGALCNRVSEKVSLLLEGWYVPGAGSGIAAGGVKIMENEFTCWNLGCLGFFSSELTGFGFRSNSIPIPYFGLGRKFR